MKKKNNYKKTQSSKEPRQGWAEACKRMHANQDDKLLIDDHLDLDFENWDIN